MQSMNQNLNVELVRNLGLKPSVVLEYIISNIENPVTSLPIPKVISKDGYILSWHRWTCMSTLDLKNHFRVISRTTLTKVLKGLKFCKLIRAADLKKTYEKFGLLMNPDPRILNTWYSPNMKLVHEMASLPRSSLIPGQLNKHLLGHYSSQSCMNILRTKVIKMIEQHKKREVERFR